MQISLVLVVGLGVTSVRTHPVTDLEDWYVEPKAHPIFSYGTRSGSEEPEVLVVSDRKEHNSKMTRIAASPEEETEVMGRRIPIWYRPDRPFNVSAEITVGPEVATESEALDSHRFISTLNLIRGKSTTWSITSTPTSTSTTQTTSRTTSKSTSKSITFHNSNKRVQSDDDRVTSTTSMTPTQWWDSQPVVKQRPASGGSQTTSRTTSKSTSESITFHNSNKRVQSDDDRVTSTTSMTPTQWWDSQPVVKQRPASGGLHSPEVFYDYPLDELEPPTGRPNFQTDIAEGHLFRNRPAQEQQQPKPVIHSTTKLVAFW